MYGKLFTSMFDGSIHGHWQAIVVLQQMVILSDAGGNLDATPETLSARTSIPLEIWQVGIADLLQPDPKSRSQDHEGRRIIPLEDGRDWGWIVVNKPKYSGLVDEDDRRRQWREAQRKKRTRKDGHGMSQTNDDCHQMSQTNDDCHQMSSHVDVDVDVNTELQLQTETTKALESPNGDSNAAGTPAGVPSGVDKTKSKSPKIARPKKSKPAPKYPHFAKTDCDAIFEKLKTLGWGGHSFAYDRVRRAFGPYFTKPEPDFPLPELLIGLEVSRSKAVVQHTEETTNPERIAQNLPGMIDIGRCGYGADSPATKLLDAENAILRGEQLPIFRP